MITDRTIDELQAAVKPEVIKVGGEEFTTKPVHRAPLEQYQKEPQPATLILHSLTALIEYVKSVDANSALDTEGDRHFFVHVESPTQVSVLTDLYGESKQRDVLATAKFEHSAFPFGQDLDNETFIVFLQARFHSTADRDNVLKVVGNLKDESVTQFNDDGVTQQVTARAGIARVETVAVPNPVRLAPFRTFPEILQPESPFILRVKSGNPVPRCALHEADGGTWVNVAREAIQEFLKAELGDTIILA